MSRVAYLAGSKIPSRAANAVQSINMCAAFAENGHDVDAFCRAGEGDAFALYGVPRSFRLHALPPKGIRGTHTARFIAEVHQRARAAQPDVYFARDVLALATMAGAGRPLILEVHRSMDGHRLEELTLRWLHRRPDFRRLIVVSHGMRRAFLERFSELDPAKILVLPGAARAVPTTPTSGWGGRAGALQVGYVGHLYEGRGIEIVVAMAAARHDIDFHVVGGEPSDIEAWRARGTTSNLTFHGFVSHAALQPRLAAFDVLVAPYQRQVFVQGGAETSAVMSPLKIFEYMSTARPMVCSDLPVLREVLDDDTALLVPPDDIDAWAGAVDRLRDETVRARVGAAARQRFLDRHTWSARAHAALAGIVEAG